MDKHIGDIHSAIVGEIPLLPYFIPFVLTWADREIEIVQGLLEDVMVFEAAMTRACDICAELDCLLSFAEASRAYEYHRPELTEENVLIVKGGRCARQSLTAFRCLNSLCHNRHPLQELVVDTFVPNDVHLVGSDFSGNIADFDDNESRSSNSLFEDSYNSIIVCTGANACGKVRTFMLFIIIALGQSSSCSTFTKERLSETGCYDTVHGTGTFYLPHDPSTG